MTTHSSAETNQRVLARFWNEGRRAFGFAALAAALAVVVALPGAHAADSSSAAAAIFEKGRAALGRGDYEAACAHFAMSHQLEPSVGTLLNLGLCNEMRGMLAQALDYWRQAEQRARAVRDDRVELARKRVAELDKRVPRLTVALRAGAPQETTVKWSEAESAKLHPIGPERLGKPIRVNSGIVLVHVDAPDHERRTYEVTLSEGDDTHLEVEVGTPGGGRAPPGGEEGTSTSGSAWRVAGFVTGGVGLTGLVLGAVFGGVASAKWSESEDPDESGLPRCDANNACTQEGLDLRDEATTAANVSNVGLIAGGVLLAAGVVMVLAAPDDGAAGGEAAGVSTVRLGVGLGSLSLQLDW